MSSIASHDSRVSPVQPGWESLPPEYAIPRQAPPLAEAQAYCRRLAADSLRKLFSRDLVPAAAPAPAFLQCVRLLPHLRRSGDEVGDPAASLQLLDQWEAELDACYAGEPRHPVFVALAETVRAVDIPKQPFADLLTAFRQDQRVTRYPTFQDVLGYCHNSANPVGHLVLYVCGYRDAERQRLSDFTCTALQLANFWQDVSVDYAQRPHLSAA